MKKLLFLLMMMLLPMVAMPIEVEIDGLWYEIITKTGEAKVIKSQNVTYSGNIVIPETVEYEGNVYNVTGIGNEAFWGCSSLKNITISDNITNIGQYAFYNCNNLLAITMSNNLETIGSQAFWGCSSLSSITIPSSVTNIGSQAFESCRRLASVYISDLNAWCNIVFDYDSNPLHWAHHLYLNGEEIKDLVIPNNVTAIGSRAFSGCSNLSSVMIPNCVTSIGLCAFEDCTGLSTITIPNSVTSIGGAAFWNCTGLTSVFLQEGLAIIENQVFQKCKSLSTIIIPNSVKSIGRWAFLYCSNLKTITIGEGVETIYTQAFSDCPELSNVYCFAKNVPKMINDDPPYSPRTDAFFNSLIEYAKLHVPDSSIDAYKTTAPWSEFGTISGLDGTIPETQKCATPTIQIVDGKLKLSCETEGVTFVTSYTSDGFSDSTLDDEIVLAGTTTCHVSVYATKEGYENSDVATVDVDLHIGKKGDVNADGVVDITDAVGVVNIILEKNE